MDKMFKIAVQLSSKEAAVSYLQECMAEPYGPKWISVGDALPEEGRCVDSWAKISGGDHNGDTGRIENVFYDHEEDFWWHHNENNEQPVLIGACVTHWMPLPKAPD
ncbi:MAG: DUF551 domain-containing protein [Oleispira sp.]|nr:DUF551 domain-containing protein [Oleispira sp.]